MSIEITRTTEGEEWNRLLERADAVSPFHRYEALTVCAEHANADLHALVGRKGGRGPSYSSSSVARTVRTAERAAPPGVEPGQPE